MNVLTLYIGGIPASGKSTIFKRLREEMFRGATPKAAGLCKYINAGQFYMIGVFDGSTFEGTDKLSMTAIGDSINFIKGLETLGGKRVVLVEGDRLFCERFLKSTGARVFIIEAEDSVIRKRRQERVKNGHTMSSTFLKSRHTKVEKLSAQFRARRLPNNTQLELERNIQVLKLTAQSWINRKGN